MKLFKRIGMLLAALFVMSAMPAWSSDTCDLAKTVAQKASAIFTKDKAEGLKLFIKARQLCAQDPIHAYNLGVAYYQYGRLDEAASNLAEAVNKKGGNGQWLNNLAAVLLEKREYAKALAYAEQAAKQTGNSASVQDTLARARYWNGKEVDALKGLNAKIGKPEGRELQKTYDELVDAYLSRNLEEVQAGRIDAGLQGLTGIKDFEPKAARAQALVLAKSGRSADALAAAADAKKRFSNNSEVAEAYEDIANQVALSLYQEFQNGKGAQAVQRAKGLAEQYPVQPIKEAYNKLLEAFLADASGITVPKAVARKRSPAGGSGRADAMLASLGSGKGASAEVDLTVDVEANIPQGKKAGKFDIAVVIGNRDYSRSNTPDVDYAARDARTMREYLEKTFGYDPGNIIYAEDATLSDLNRIFGSVGDYRGQLYKYVKPNLSNVFVYYVGHGAPDLESGDAYFIPVDADPQFLKNSGYRLQTFYANLAKVPAREMTVVLDACFSGNSAKGQLFKGVSSIGMRVNKEKQAKPANAVVFTSAQDDQVSTWYPEKRHSLFTYYFLKGMQGEADANRDRQLTVAEMDGYLAEQVPYMARRLKGTEQRPSVAGKPEQVLTVLLR